MWAWYILKYITFTGVFEKTVGHQILNFNLKIFFMFLSDYFFQHLYSNKKYFKRKKNVFKINILK